MACCERAPRASFLIRDVYLTRQEGEEGEGGGEGAERGEVGEGGEGGAGGERCERGEVGGENETEGLCFLNGSGAVTHCSIQQRGR